MKSSRDLIKIYRYYDYKRKNIKMKKTILTVFLICFACANFYTQSVDESLESLSKNMASWLQESTMTLNTTADAHIGKVVPSIPPHFQVGFSASTTIIDTAPISNAAAAINAEAEKNGDTSFASFPKFGKVFVMPTYSINLRFGGFYLPFDIGLFGTFTIPPQGVKFGFQNSNINAKQMNLGVDIRYAILQGKNAWPKLSVGFGYFYNSHEYTFSASAGETNETSIGLNFKMHTIYAQLQISKQFSFLLPYVGVRASLSKVDNEYSYETIATESQSQKVNNNFDIKEVQPQIYAGLGFMIPYSQITLNGAYNPRRNQWSVSIHAGFRL